MSWAGCGVFGPAVGCRLAPERAQSMRSGLVRRDNLIVVVAAESVGAIELDCVPGRAPRQVQWQVQENIFCQSLQRR